MSPLSTKYNKHILVCTKEREEGSQRGSCSVSGGLDIRNQLVRLINSNGLKGKVRATKSGCMDCCEVGPVVVIYPQNIWYVGVSQDDIDEIFNRSILKDQIIKRLIANENTWKELSLLRKKSNIDLQKSLTKKL